MKTAASAALKDFDLLNMYLSCDLCLGAGLDLLAVATNAAIHALERAAPTSQEDGVWLAEVVSAGLLQACRGIFVNTYLIDLQIRFSKIGMPEHPSWEAFSHDHGMASAAHVDEVPVTFNTNPSNRKVMS